LKQTFTKSERLSSKKLIEKLFKEGDSFYVFPFRVSHLAVDAKDDYPAQFLISVSKRNFKNATDRNRIKRLVREACRKQKGVLFEKKPAGNKQLLIALIYTAKTILSYAELERKIILILHRLIEQDEQAAG
jgi:ribonuclease P protein component